MTTNKIQFKSNGDGIQCITETTSQCKYVNTLNDCTVLSKKNTFTARSQSGNKPVRQYRKSCTRTTYSIALTVKPRRDFGETCLFTLLATLKKTHNTTNKKT